MKTMEMVCACLSSAFVAEHALLVHSSLRRQRRTSHPPCIMEAMHARANPIWQSGACNLAIRPWGIGAIVRGKKVAMCWFEQTLRNAVRLLVLLATMAHSTNTKIQSGNLARVMQNSKRHAAPSSFRPQHARRGGWPIAREDPVSHAFLPLPRARLLPPFLSPPPRPTATWWPSGGRPPPRLAPWQEKDTQAYGPWRAIQNKKKQNKKKLKVKDRS